MIKEERFNSLYKQKVGDVIVLHKTNSSIIELASNSLYLKGWSIFIFGVGIYICYMLNIPFDPFVWQAVLVEFLIFVAFTAVSIAYWRKGSRGVFLRIDLDNNVFKFKRTVIPFNAVWYLKISQLNQDPFNNPNVTSYQLNLIFQNDNDYTIITAENSSEYELRQVARYLAKETGIKFDYELYNA